MRGLGWHELHKVRDLRNKIRGALALHVAEATAVVCVHGE